MDFKKGLFSLSRPLRIHRSVTKAWHRFTPVRRAKQSISAASTLATLKCSCYISLSTAETINCCLKFRKLQLLMSSIFELTGLKNKLEFTSGNEIDSQFNRNWNTAFGGFCLFVFNSDIFLFFIFISATEADSQDSAVLREPGQPSSSPEETSRDQSVYSKQ